MLLLIVVAELLRVERGGEKEQGSCPKEKGGEGHLLMRWMREACKNGNDIEPIARFDEGTSLLTEK